MEVTLLKEVAPLKASCAQARFLVINKISEVGCHIIFAGILYPRGTIAAIKSDPNVTMLFEPYSKNQRMSTSQTILNSTIFAKLYSILSVFMSVSHTTS